MAAGLVTSPVSWSCFLEVWVEEEVEVEEEYWEGGLWGGIKTSSSSSCSYSSSSSNYNCNNSSKSLLKQWLIFWRGVGEEACPLPPPPPPYPMHACWVAWELGEEEEEGEVSQSPC